MKFLWLLLVVCSSAMMFGQNNSQLPKLHAYTAVRPAHVTPGAAAVTASSLPLWSFSTTSSRDGNNYSGVMVGTSPFDGGDGSTSVRTQVIPVIIKVHRVATSINGRPPRPVPFLFPPDMLDWPAQLNHTGLPPSTRRAPRFKPIGQPALALQLPALRGALPVYFVGNESAELA